MASASDCHIVYSDFCKAQFAMLFRKHDELALRQEQFHQDIQKGLSELNGRLYIDNGKRSLSGRVQDNEATCKQFLEYMETRNDYARSWRELFFDLLGKAIWVLCAAFVGYLVAKSAILGKI